MVFYTLYTFIVMRTCYGSLYCYYDGEVVKLLWCVLCVLWLLVHTQDTRSVWSKEW